MKIKTTLDLRPYPFECHLVIGCDKVELFNWIYKTFKTEFETSGACGSMITLKKIDTEELVFIVWVKDIISTTGFSIVAHEIYHLVSAVMRAVNINESEETEEMRAYYYQMLFLEAMNKCSRQIVKKKKKMGGR